jgi:hypothetical protein
MARGSARRDRTSVLTCLGRQSWPPARMPRTADVRADLSGPTSRRVTSCRTAAIQRVTSCELRMPPRSQQDAPGGIRTLPPRPTWLDVLVRIVGPDPASFIYVGSDTEIRHCCHLIDTFILERVREKCVELRGFEPLTSCMPCLTVSSDAIALGRVMARQDNGLVWLGLAASATAWARCHLVCHWKRPDPRHRDRTRPRAPLRATMPLRACHTSFM